MRLKWWRRRSEQETTDVKQKLQDALEVNASARAQLVETEHLVRRANAVAETAKEIGKRNGFYDLWVETFQLK